MSLSVRLLIIYFEAQKASCVDSKSKGSNLSNDENLGECSMLEKALETILIDGQE